MRPAPLLSIVLAACGSSRPAGPVDPCAGTTCGENEQVDPATCGCTCGDPVLALACAADQVCTSRGGYVSCEPAPCAGVTCERGAHCDPATELCVCGALPSVVCAEFQTCVNERCLPASRCESVDCGVRGACDERDGTCRCGGLVCGAQERCTDDACVRDACLGVGCPEGTACNRDDELCHCGGELGPVCAAGQTCAQGACEPPGCGGVTCGPGEVCDPDIGACRCGGIGPEFPRCAYSPGLCDLTGPFPRCRCAGDCCRDRDCAREVPGSVCEPEFGECMCGDVFEGEPCRAPSACGERDGKPACLPP